MVQQLSNCQYSWCAMYQNDHPFKRTLKAIRESVDSTDLVELITLLSKSVNKKLYRKQSIESLRASLQFAGIFNALAGLKCDKIQKTMRNQQPLTKGLIYFSHLIDSDLASAIIVFLPKGEQFSLHDHPSMLVFTKVLVGRLQIDSMDLCNPHPSPPASPNSNLLKQDPAKQTEQSNNTECQDYHQQSMLENYRGFVDQSQIKGTLSDYDFEKITPQLSHTQNRSFQISQTKNWQRKVITNKDVMVTSPENGNIHGLIALTDCIFLDILVPDYETCPIYYEYDGGSKNGCPLIREVSKPKELGQYISLDQP